MEHLINALILGDIVGHPGCRALFVNLKQIVKETRADFVVVNGENAADGFGLTVEIAERLFSLGVHVITTGNHVWQKREILSFMETRSDVLRPANYPPGTAGSGYCVQDIRGIKIGVINLQGRESLSTVDCPFRTAKDIIRKLKSETSTIIIDFHAESVKEKESLAYFLDGTVSAVLGTHTHVQTADERILSSGTAYISDIGMTGPLCSVIGGDPATAIERSLTQMPLKLDIPDIPATICGVLLKIDTSTGKTQAIDRIRIDSAV